LWHAEIATRRFQDVPGEYLRRGVMAMLRFFSDRRLTMPTSSFLRHGCPLFPLAAVMLFTPGVLLGQTAAPPTEAAQTGNFDQPAQQAAVAREAGHRDEAVRYYREALKVRPKWDEGWWFVATLSYEGERYADAIPAFNQFLEINPSVGAAWNFLGLSEFETKDYKNSFVHLQKGQDLGFADSPDAVKVAKYHLALLLNLNGQFDKATALLAAEFGQDSLPEHVKMVLGMAMLRVPLLPDQVDPSKSALLHAAAETAALLNTADLNQASQRFQQMLRDYPGTPYLQYAYASVLTSISRDQDAMAHLRAESHITPDSALSFISMAALLLREHAAEQALHLAEHAVKLAPESAAAHQVLGETLKELGKDARAAKEFDAASKLQPERPQVDVNQVRFYARSSVLGRASSAFRPSSFRSRRRTAATRMGVKLS
jgi:tetratricopeptide (TPR) repeat protein